MDKLTLSVWYKGYKDLRVLYELLEKYSFFKPKEIYIDEDTDTSLKIRKLNESKIKELFYEACKNGNGSCITIGGHCFSLLLAPTINIGDFYIASLDISPEILKNDYTEIEKIFKEFVCATQAFYGMVDSIYNSGDLFDDENEDAYKPDEYIQTLFWGNYFGKAYASNLYVLKIIKLGNCIAERVEDGWFVKLSEDVSGVSSEEVKKKRKKLRKYIKSITGCHLIRYKDE